MHTNIKFNFLILTLSIHIYARRSELWGRCWGCSARSGWSICRRRHSGCNAHSRTEVTCKRTLICIMIGCIGCCVVSGRCGTISRWILQCRNGTIVVRSLVQTLCVVARISTAITAIGRVVYQLSGGYDDLRGGGYWRAGVIILLWRRVLLLYRRGRRTWK